MERQPHVRVPHEAFFDQPPRAGEVGYDDLYTNTIDLELYKKQQKALEIFVDAEEKKILLRKMTECALKAGNMWNAERQCADLVEEYSRRLPHAPQFGVRNFNFFNFLDSKIEI